MRVQGSWFRVQGSGFTVWNLRVEVRGMRLRVRGFGVEDEGCPHLQVPFVEPVALPPLHSCLILKTRILKKISVNEIYYVHGYLAHEKTHPPRTLP